MAKKNKPQKQIKIETVEPKPMNQQIAISSVEYLKNLFNLQDDTDEEGSLDSIKRSVEFKGGNLWALVFAIFIASIGLNVNSTAVIIGAMLISPLMGPIIGAGLAIAIYDFELLKKSLRNLSVATFISILTSAIYFSIRYECATSTRDGKKATLKNIFHLLHPNLHLPRIRIMGNNFAAPNNPPYSGA